MPLKNSIVYIYDNFYNKLELIIIIISNIWSELWAIITNKNRHQYQYQIQKLNLKNVQLI